ncbi:MAG: hypothetical protein EA402_04460, partial [Planctomycetota bacterium]
MFDTLITAQKPLLRVWAIADLQQGMPSMIEECLRYGVEDIAALDLGLDAIWYLGDATEGKRSAVVNESVAIQQQLLGSLQVPVRFIMGNHDLDCARNQSPGEAPILPMWQAVAQDPQWRTTDTPQDFFFLEEHGPWLVVFLSDHIAADCSWLVSWNDILGQHPERYPHHHSAWQALRTRIAAWDGPVILAGHYAFPGGTRGGNLDSLHARLMPFSPNVGLVLHGHAHLGDFAYGHEQCYRRMSYVDYHDLAQVNVSSLDRTRGSQSRSAIIDLHADHSISIWFRDHEDRCWTDALQRNCAAPRTLSP